MITSQKLNNPDTILIVYPAGTGGEQIAHTLSVCSKEYEILKTDYNEDKNQYHTVCALNYSTLITDIEKFDTAIDSRYVFNKNSRKKIILKDHPSERTLEFYSKHLPDITVLFVTPFTEFEYFANLTFNKLAKKITPPITEEFLKKEISDTLSDSEINHLIDQTNQYPWIWRHELHNLIYRIRKDSQLHQFYHNDDLSDIKEDHLQTLINTYIITVPLYQNKFKNMHKINCDSFIQNSYNFWKSIRPLVPSLDVDNATKITNKWIAQNNKLGEL